MNEIEKKEIEEMAKEFCPIVCPNQCNHRCANVGNCQELKEACIKIRDLGYRNVKDKEVLTEEKLKEIVKEEYEKALKDKVVLDKEEYIENDRLMKLLEEKRLDELKSIHKIFDEVRKETAREIFKWLERHCFSDGFEIIKAYFKEKYGEEVE